jgi:hypothetical protein
MAARTGKGRKEKEKEKEKALSRHVMSHVTVTRPQMPKAVSCYERSLVPTWKNHIVKQFDIINRSTTKESDLFGAYNTLLFDLFPPSECYDVAPLFRRNTGTRPGSVDYTISYVVFKSEIPIFFVEIKTFVALDLGSARAVADNQMRTIFLDFSSDPLPQAKLIGISAMGTHFAVYEYTTDDRHLNPPRINHHPGIIPDTAPKERWGYDLMEDSGEAKFKALVNEAKEMASAFGDVCEYYNLYYPCPSTDLGHRTSNL